MQLKFKEMLQYNSIDTFKNRYEKQLKNHKIFYKYEQFEEYVDVYIFEKV